MKRRAEAILIHLEAYAAANNIPLGSGPQVETARKIIEVCERQILDAKKENQ